MKNSIALDATIYLNSKRNSGADRATPRNPNSR